MSKAILYVTAAGAVGIGGLGTALLLLQLGRQEAAAYLLTRNSASAARVLRSQVDLAPLLEEARAAGIDPGPIMQAYHDMRDGLITFDQVAAWLGTLGQGSGHTA